MRTRALVPVGYAQGAYRLVDEDSAEKELNGTVDLSALERELAATPAGSSE